MNFFLKYTFLLLSFCSTCNICKAAAGNFIFNHLSDKRWGPIILISTRSLDIFMPSKFFDKDGNPVAFKGYKLTKDNDIVSVDKDLKFINLSITKNILWLFLSLILLILLFFICSRWYKKNSFYKAPSGIINAVEMLILMLNKDVIRENIGDYKYKKFSALLLTIFFHIWINNMLGLLPGAGNVTSNITVTACLAILVFIVVNINGTKSYYKEIFFPKVPKFLYPIMVPIEFLNIFTKPLTLMIRLFSNMFSGHVMILSMISLIFSSQSFFVGILISFLNALMLLLKVLVCFLQAYIFVLLSSIYIGNAVKEEED